ncbi:hypothetical protein HK405_011485, partial [Cladochytrium tenue]
MPTATPPAPSRGSFSSVGSSAAPTPVSLMRVLGMAAPRPATLAVHPRLADPLVAYPAGALVVLYSVSRDSQSYLCAASTSAAVTTTTSSTSSPAATAVHSPDSDAGDHVGGLQQGMAGVLPARRPAAAAARSVTCVEFSPDGRFLAAGESGHQPRVLVWDHARGALLSELQGHRFGVQDVRFAPGSRHVVSVGFQLLIYTHAVEQHDGMVHVWNWATGQKLASVRAASKLHALRFDQSGEFFVTCGFRHFKFWRWDAARMAKPAPSSSGSRGAMAAAATTLEGEYAVVGEHKNSAFVDAACHGRSSSGAPTVVYAITERGILAQFNSDFVMEKWVDLK